MLLVYDGDSGLEISFFFREPNCIFYIETSTSFCALQKFEGAPGEFKGALGSRHPLISSPGRRTFSMYIRNVIRKCTLKVSEV